MRRELESLLASDAQASDFLAMPALTVAAEEIAAEQAQSLSGKLMGHYRILSLLGAGGMGEVYLAEDVQLGRKAALKLLPGEFTQDRERLDRFEREARAASALNHPNIITIYEIGEVNGIHFIAAEFIDGQTLRQRIKSEAMKLGEALDMSIQIAAALATAHEAGIVHRDIKPENIMVRRDGYIKVLDFGLAKLIVRPSEKFNSIYNNETLTREQIKTDPGKIMGTARYMSPEQIRGQEVDGRSDIFSLGVVLYELVTGHAPFGGGTAGEVMAAILTREPPSLTRYLREAPAELERMVSRALAKEPEARYQFVKDFLIDLKNLKLELQLEVKLKSGDRSGENETAERAAQDVEQTSQCSETESLYSTQISHPASQSSGLREMLEPAGGAVPLASKFYIIRPTDAEFQSAIVRQDSIVLVKGARQVGKTSLLARGLQQAREAGSKVILTDFQSLNAECLESIEKLYLTLAGLIADQLDLDVFPDQVWHPKLSPSINFERYLRREILAKVSSPIVWGIDEIDQLFTCDFGSEVFGLFRSWHNKRALDPQGPWHRLSLAIAYATEAHLFITNLNQSPFNVGTRLLLEDFTLEQVEELNRRYGSPLRDQAEVTRYFHLVGGHPYLVRRGLYEIAAHGMNLAVLESLADHDEGPFGDHLHRILVSLTQDQALCEVVPEVLQSQYCPTSESFYRLRSAGLMSGDSAQKVKPRCQLYATYLGRHLL
ncbi:MAG: AAA-like domain-containing protein [Acidobacteria bacterium]|nr:AAA-like domain-containing protein [Acidobacteriota bacterium]